MFIDFRDPAPSKLSYRLNRLAYKLWFKLVVLLIASLTLIFIAREFIFERFDLSRSLSLMKENTFLYFQDISQLKVNNLIILGASEKLEEKIKFLIKDNQGNSFSKLSIKNLRQKIIEMDMVKNAVVKFSTKGNISVEVIERKGLVVFFEGSSYVLLDEEGIRISSFNEWKAVPKLPLLVGEGANRQLKNFLLMYEEDLQSISVEIEFYEWISERRWDIHFKNKKIVKLPEKNTEKALDFLIQLKEQGLLENKKVLQIDLRHLERPLIKLKGKLTTEKHSHVLLQPLKIGN